MKAKLWLYSHEATRSHCIVRRAEQGLGIILTRYLNRDLSQAAAGGKGVQQEDIVGRKGPGDHGDVQF